jgi:hypothetical protein
MTDGQTVNSPALTLSLALVTRSLSRILGSRPRCRYAAAAATRQANCECQLQ